jgi:hypothetical protein
MKDLLSIKRKLLVLGYGNKGKGGCIFRTKLIKFENFIIISSSAICSFITSYFDVVTYFFTF